MTLLTFRDTGVPVRQRSVTVVQVLYSYFNCCWRPLPKLGPWAQGMGRESDYQDTIPEQ